MRSRGHYLNSRLLFVMVALLIWGPSVCAWAKQPIKAIYIPMADHYPGIVAYEKYRDRMKKAEYTIQRMESWPLLRAYFMSGEVDMAYIVGPMAMDMYAQKPNFRWVSLLHRDGNALAINDLLNAEVKLPQERIRRKPDQKVAHAFAKMKARSGNPVECAVPSLLSTHTVALYKYLADHGKEMSLGVGKDKDVRAIAVAPPKSPSFLKQKNSRNTPAAFEQSLPWADVVETQEFGHVAWYSKDVLPWPKGHVDCIVIATDKAIREKIDALREVIYYLHQAGLDIEAARKKGGPDMIAISGMIRKHIPEHSQDAIIQSLRPDLNVINYYNLNVDKAGLKQIMDYAVKGGILKKRIDIDAFADSRFSTKITEQEPKGASLTYSGNADKITDRMKMILEREVGLINNWMANPILIAAVKEQNSKKVPLDTVKAIDRQWIAGGQKELAQRLQNNKVGLYLQEKISSNKALYTEAFLCDRQGAVVGEYPMSSDYWQGNEEKFIDSYKEGKGETLIGPLLLDESTRTFSVQVSIPVREGNDTIGVLIVGLRNLREKMMP